jgi:hypothetical protein
MAATMTNEFTRLASNAERLITTDFSGRNTIDVLRQAVTDAQGSNSVLKAAEALVEAVNSGDWVVILTGFLEPPAMIQETDGPPGAVALARALDVGLDANVIIASEAQSQEVIKGIANACELNVVERETNRNWRNSVTIETFPADRANARVYASELADLDPAAVIAIEKTGINRVGEFHTMGGQNITAESAKVDELFEILDDITTVSVGDGGNEIGMGKIESAVRKNIEHGADCGCPCEEGIADTVMAEYVVCSTVSNWGAYGVIVCLGEILNRQLLHSPEVEMSLLRRASHHGAVDGFLGVPNGWCDGFPPSAHASIVRLLNQLRETLPEYHASQ